MLEIFEIAIMVAIVIVFSIMLLMFLRNRRDQKFVDPVIMRARRQLIESRKNKEL